MSEGVRPNISIGTLNGPYGGRKKASISRAIMTEIPHGAKLRGSSRDALSGATEVPCVTHNGVVVLESIKKTQL